MNGMAFCHPSWDRVITVTFGEIDFEVTVCGHVYDSSHGETRSSVVCELMEELYAPIHSVSHNDSLVDTGVVAFTAGFSRRYAWHICDCGKLGGYSGRFCSEACEVKARGNGCTWCRVHARRYIESEYSRKCRDRDSRYYYRHLKEFVSHDSLYCSVECMSLHTAEIKRQERRERKRKRELQCVQDVSKLLTKARKALKSNNREALPSLSEEFKRVRTSRA